MNELIKIKELSTKYGITTKTLRYYEEMGLIQSRRTNDYAYRMYDGEAIKRLEQILILRKLSISIKDIKRIFDTSGSEVVLDVLNKKADDIDEEIALLHELKEIVLKFIRQIRQADFSKDSDIKMLYENANEIEKQIISAENDHSDENIVNLDRLVEVSDKLNELADMKIGNQLEQIAKSYDRHFIEYEKKDALSYDNLPDYIINDPDYPYWKNEQESEPSTGSERKKHVKDFLMPGKGMKLIQLGCGVNFITHKHGSDYNKWPSTYYGVDISSETISTLNYHIAENNLSIGSLYCGSVHETPFKDNYFDIGDCIGVLEYYEKGFVEKIVAEAHRIMKPDGKFVFDIPNIQSPSGRIMMLIEECMGRPCEFNMSPDEFEAILEKYFEIETTSRTDNKSMGFGYYLKCKK